MHDEFVNDNSFRWLKKNPIPSQQANGMGEKSALLTEIRQSKAGRRLILALLAQGNNDQYYQSYYVRQHLIQLLYGKLCTGWNVEVQYVESAEEY